MSDIAPVKFGDIFRHREREYVYLASTDEVLYAARILDGNEAIRIAALYEAKNRTGKLEKVKDNPIFCYVVLTVEEFRDRMAHFHNSAQSAERDYGFDIIGAINETDMKNIKAEIVRKESPLPTQLKELVGELDIK